MSQTKTHLMEMAEHVITNETTTFCNVVNSTLHCTLGLMSNILICNYSFVGMGCHILGSCSLSSFLAALHIFGHICLSILLHQKHNLVLFWLFGVSWHTQYIFLMNVVRRTAFDSHQSWSQKFSIHWFQALKTKRVGPKTLLLILNTKSHLCVQTQWI